MQSIFVSRRIGSQHRRKVPEEEFREVYATQKLDGTLSCTGVEFPINVNFSYSDFDEHAEDRLEKFLMKVVSS